MAHNHKRAPNRAPGCELRMCEICGTMVQRIEKDHLFGWQDDPDFTISLCVPCHREVTIWDAATLRYSDRDAVSAPFIRVLHRMQLAMAKRCDSRVDFSAVEKRFTGNSYVPRNARKTNSSARRKARGDGEELFISSISSWVRRAGELTMMRLDASGQAMVRPDYDEFMSFAGELAEDPRQFYEMLTAYLSSEDGSGLSDRVTRLFSLIEDKESVTGLRTAWRETAVILQRACNVADTRVAVS